MLIFNLHFFLKLLLSTHKVNKFFYKTSQKMTE